MTYTTEAIDLGATVPFAIAWEAETAGDATLQYRTADSAAALAATASWAGSAAAGREVPTTLAHVTDIDLTLQAVGPGWSWALDNKNDPTRIKIFDGDGNPADATVDAVLHGIA